MYFVWLQGTLYKIYLQTKVKTYSIYFKLKNSSTTHVNKKQLSNSSDFTRKIFLFTLWAKG
uniref:Uncharacterized protein n=1 Tax=Arundo donax TaxID=35708 RepID=A0A0A9D0V3_ARUDO